MKRGIALIALGTLMLILSTGVASATTKVTICHAAGQDGTTKYVTLTIGYKAVYGPAGHFYENGTPRAGHEDDYLGACIEEEPSTTTSTQGTTSTSSSSTTVTTTEPPPTTTTVPTTVTSSSTTTVPQTATTSTQSPQTTTSTVPPTTTTTPPTELPMTGVNLGWFALAGAAFMALGLGTLALSKE